MTAVPALAFADCYLDTSGVVSNTTLFIREENKKSSFVLSNVAILQVQSCSSEDGCTSWLAAAASISYRAVGSNNPDEIFLFGGFEMIANVNSLKVFVTRAESDKGEEYLTSCKGIPARDLPQLEIDQTDKIQDINDMNWFKFVLASPGGAKPVNRVRLEFQIPESGDQNPTSVITRMMKVKCRLNDLQGHGSAQLPAMQPSAAGGANIKSLTSMMYSMTQHAIPTNNASQYQQYTPSTGDGKDLTSLMAMMGNMNTKNSAIPSSLTNQSAQQQTQQNSDKSHAQMMSSIAGLGMYLKSSEEKRMRSLETMLLQMESRMSAKLDSLSCRLDVIEQHLNTNVPYNDKVNSSSMSNNADDKIESAEE